MSRSRKVRSVSERPPEQTQLVVDHDCINVDGTYVHIDDRVQHLRERLSLRPQRARSFTRRMYLLYAAMAKARTLRSDGYLSVEDIARLDAWGNGKPARIAKALVNDLKIHDNGLVEQRGHGLKMELRLRTPWVEIVELPEIVVQVFADGHGESAPIGDARPQAVADPELAKAIANSLLDVDGTRRLQVAPLYQGGRRSLVFAGLSVERISSRGQPIARTVLVKLPIGGSADTVIEIDEGTLATEGATLRSCIGWPGLPEEVEWLELPLPPLRAAIEHVGRGWAPTHSARSTQYSWTGGSTCHVDPNVAPRRSCPQTPHY